MPEVADFMTARSWHWRRWSFHRPAQIMGILNVTPDSFSDGGLHLDHQRAIIHGLAMAKDGAAWIDVGGESTRPGSTPVSAAVELARVLPVIRALAAAGVAVSIDTSKAEVAEVCVASGAQMVNDVTAGGDAAMAGVVARHGVPWVIMHLRGTPATMHLNPTYSAVVSEVGDHLQQRLAAAVLAGVDPSQILIDPGIGFGKTSDHNLALLRGLDQLEARFDRPVVVGISRKSFLPRLLGRDVSPAERDAASHVLHGLLAPRCALLRVHDVRGCRDALRLTAILDGDEPC